MYDANVSSVQQEDDGCFTVGLLLLLVVLSLLLCFILCCCCCCYFFLLRHNFSPAAAQQQCLIFAPCFDNLPSNNPLPDNTSQIYKLKTSTPVLVMRSMCYVSPIIIAAVGLYLIATAAINDVNSVDSTSSTQVPPSPPLPPP